MMSQNSCGNLEICAAFAEDARCLCGKKERLVADVDALKWEKKGYAVAKETSHGII